MSKSQFPFYPSGPSYITFSQGRDTVNGNLRNSGQWTPTHVKILHPEARATGLSTSATYAIERVQKRVISIVFPGIHIHDSRGVS